MSKKYQSDTQNIDQDSKLNWNNVFPSRYLAKHWDNLPEKSLPGILIKELGYIVEHIREIETRFEYSQQDCRTTLKNQQKAIHLLLEMQEKLCKEQLEVNDILVTLNKTMNETKAMILMLQKELYLAKTYPVNGSAIRLSSTGSRRKIRTYVNTQGTGST